MGMDMSATTNSTINLKLAVNVSNTLLGSMALLIH